MPATRVYELLTRLGRLLQAEERSDTGLVAVQVQALHFLARANRYSRRPQNVGDYLGVTKGTASQTVKVLEERGLVQKTTHPSDRRSVMLELTAQGRSLVRQSLPIERLEAALGGASSEALETSLEELLRTLQLSQAGAAFGVCKTCNHFERLPAGGARCGLTRERLKANEVELLCAEHSDGAD